MLPPCATAARAISRTFRMLSSPARTRRPKLRRTKETKEAQPCPVRRPGPYERNENNEGRSSRSPPDFGGAAVGDPRLGCSPPGLAQQRQRGVQALGRHVAARHLPDLRPVERAALAQGRLDPVGQRVAGGAAEDEAGAVGAV